MANNDANTKKPGEKAEGKYHYNPGNMSGKTIGIVKDESEQENDIDTIKSRGEKSDSRDEQDDQNRP